MKEKLNETAQTASEYGLPENIMDIETPDTASYNQFCVAFRQRDDILNLIHQINLLIMAVQRRRGLSLGLLAGEQGFREQFERLQNQLAKGLATLEWFAMATGDLLTPREKENLHLAWTTISHNWEEDQLSDNFELHSHCIEQLQSILASLARQLEPPLVPALLEQSAVVEDASYPQQFKKIELLNFVARQLPEMIEQIAKVRGLSVYASSLGSVDFYNDRKLRFLLKYAREQSDKLRHQAERINDFLNKGFRSVTDLKNLELKLLYLLNTVEQDVLSGREIKTTSQQFFALATEIIDVYWGVVNDGLMLLRRWHLDDMEAWLKLPKTD